MALLAAVALLGAGCGEDNSGGDIVPSTGTSGETVPTTVPEGLGTGTEQEGTTTSETATGSAPPPEVDAAPPSEDEQEDAP